MTDALLPATPEPLEKENDGYFRKVGGLGRAGTCGLQTSFLPVQSQLKTKVRKVATNPKVREQARLELSFVNSDLQILKEELEGLNISLGVYQNTEEAFTIPLIPLGLKETKDVDFSVVLKDFILEHYSEDGYLYEDEIADLMDLRQACRTPSRDEAGVELLMTYFIQLGFVETTVLEPQHHRCPSVGAPVYLRVLNYLKETFTHTPSYDMSPAMLSVLVKMMLAQAQESVFEKISLPGIRNEFFMLVKVAQEAAKVGEVYQQLHAAMSQAPVKENIPYSWASLACVKAHHYAALAHYFTAILLIDHQVKPGTDVDHQEKCLSQLYDHMPEGLTPLATLKNGQQRRQLGKSHLRRAVTHHEESVREASLCKKLRSIEVLQKVLSAAQERSRLTYAQHQEDDDLLNLIDAPDVLGDRQNLKYPNNCCLPKGPLSVFSANKALSDATLSIRSLLHFAGRKDDLGFTLERGTAPQVQDSHFWILTLASHNKCATYSVGMQKTYSMICLAIEDGDKTDKTKKISKKLSFLSWGTKNRQKSASTLCLPSVGVARPQIKKKLPSPFSLLNSDSSLY
uniref:Rhophilin Rho GTPase binding protein 2 n=1 Tax=Aotus nancymaae TaxID=37293 RepID=A0A2K5ESG3_AOTNA